MQKNDLAKAQYPFMIKTHAHTLEKKKLEIEGHYHNMIKCIYKQPTANMILNGERLKLFL